MKYSTASKMFTMTAIACALSACNSSDDDKNQYVKPIEPIGTSYTETVAVPALSGSDIAIVDGNIPVTNDKNNIVAFDETASPMLQILNGFNRIWTHGDETWASTGSNSLKVAAGFEAYNGIEGGASTSTSKALQLNFDNNAILDQTIWQENFNYVVTLTRPNQDKPDLDRKDKSVIVNAYLDDQRDKGFSITSGLGPLADDYRKGANSTSPYKVNANGDVTVGGKVIDIMDSARLMNNDLSAQITAADTSYGTTEIDGTPTELANVVKVLNAIANYGASTEAPKYHFDSPRPWRINSSDYSVASFTDFSDLTALTCYNLDGTSTVKYYDLPAANNRLVTAIDSLRCAARTIYTDKGNNSYSEGYSDPTGGQLWVSGRAKDGGYPSGHTAEAFDRALGFAYAMPERFAEMVARAGDLGQNRIVAGMHSPLDVIGGRVMATAITAAMLNDENNATMASDAVTQAHNYFLAKAQAAGYDSINEFAHCTTDASPACDATDEYADHKAMKATYRAYMTFGFNPLNEESKAPEVPKGAEKLLETRLPYLSDRQRRVVLATTQIASNYPVINQSRGWGRLDLVAAADGYGAFNENTTVDMDASKGGFSAQDRWRNDISGAGRLEKIGSGSLSLEGNNSYSGGTVLTEGTLKAASSTAFGSNTVYQKDGTLLVAIAAGATDANLGVLNVTDFVKDGGTLSLDLAKNAKIKAEKTMYLSGALQLTVPTLTAAKTYTILSSSHIEGKFDANSISAMDKANKSYSVSITYTGTDASVTVTPKA
ncbi:phosphatase PAP2 family protein [Shewanella profunda]|uniref:phosphatase PAP2 family protein n=1 Tax=Shewanella profunda TaxID=254793 RepID=UPI0020102FA2|nr:phosphatase PAP2 family protein [Shewanella profunda]MCL1090055.1 phosphatase PAP2 family protein [Shewanella profunda]